VVDPLAKIAVKEDEPLLKRRAAVETLGLIGSAAASAIASLQRLRRSADVDFGVHTAKAIMIIDQNLRLGDVESRAMPESLISS
jgi:hypothetical protein